MSNDDKNHRYTLSKGGSIYLDTILDLVNQTAVALVAEGEVDDGEIIQEVHKISLQNLEFFNNSASSGSSFFIYHTYNTLLEI